MAAKSGGTKNKFVYFFGGGKADGNGKMKDLLGGKGAGLAEMSSSGVPVPPGFTITTSVCSLYYKKAKEMKDVDKQMEVALAKLEKMMGKKLGDANDPLLVSVRSGAKFSMPGMMDTILNLGLTDKSIEGLISKTGNQRFAWDSYRRFISMFGNVVMEIDKGEFEAILKAKKKEKGISLDTEFTVDDLKSLVAGFKALYKSKTKEEFPQNPYDQLIRARNAVFKSWNNDRAITYRERNKIDHNLGTACNIQSMVFGNMGNDSATGVGFTRNPGTGSKEFFGEYLTNAQGEDVVAGIRTPKPISELKQEMPQAYARLKEITYKLEKHYKDIQDFEFTIEKGNLFMLQTRIGQRTGIAALKVAVDMVHEKLITKDEALLRVNPEIHIPQILAPIFDKAQKKKALDKGGLLAKGIAAGPGAASGKAMFTAADAVLQSQKGPVILVREETNPDDIKGMYAAKGVLTARGGQTSHAAVVARAIGLPTVVGCESIHVDEHTKTFTANGKKVKEGDFISIDGFTGEVIVEAMETKPSEILQVLRGEIPKKESELFGYWNEFMSWADQKRQIKVRANADIPSDAKMAILLGAEGIGLCRTEHMFFAEERLPFMQEMIIADTEAERRKALKKLLPFQKDDFKGLFKEMKGFPVTIRTLDPPLHEFLPKTKEDAEKLSKKINIPVDKIWEKSRDLHEFNPMLGHRGCRLGITYPEITEMQVEAIISAACELKKEGITVIPEIMIPLVGFTAEFLNQKAIVDQIAQSTMEKYKAKVQYKVGTMIEVPRGAIMAGDIAKHAEFFSFGTNDLTQMTLGFSRDDAGKFIAAYQTKEIFKSDPFQTLDQEGVGELIKMAVASGRKTRKDLKIGICGEHGGDPASVIFCHRTGLNYVSASPYRVPIARLAAAQGTLSGGYGFK